MIKMGWPCSMKNGKIFVIMLLLFLKIHFRGNFFTHRFKPTNNANNHTYWPFWITLHEDEDIVEVGARAVRLIRSVYEGYLENEDVEALRKRSDSRKESQKEDKIRFSADVNFTKEAYQELLEKIGRMSKKERGRQIKIV